MRSAAKRVGALRLDPVVWEYLEGVIRVLGEDLVELSIFGSTARGERREGSDIDILLIVRGSRLEALRRVSGMLSNLWWDLVERGVLVEKVVLSEEEWKEMLRRRSSFALNVEDEKIAICRREQNRYIRN